MVIKTTEKADGSIITEYFNVEEESPKESGYSLAQKEWREKIKIVEAKSDIGIKYYLVDENYDFIPYIKEYLEVIRGIRNNPSPSPNTYRSYCNRLWYFIVFLKINSLNILDFDGRADLFAEFRIWLLNPYKFYDNVEMLYQDIEYEEDKLDNSTINQTIYRVSALYNWLKATERIRENPVKYSEVIVTEKMKDRNFLTHTRKNKKIEVNKELIKKTKKEQKVITDKDFKRFLSKVNLLRDKIILLCFKEGGFRGNELLGIHIEDVDFASQGLHIVFRPDNINGSRAKAGVGNDRFVQLSPELMDLIDRYISTEWIQSNPDTDFLFVVIKSNRQAENGRPMKKSTLDSMLRYYSMKVFGYIKKCKKRKPIKILYSHKLRHTNATQMVREYLIRGESVNWKYISERLGHSSVTTTQDIYSHLEDMDYKKEYNRVNGMRENVNAKSSNKKQ